MRKLWLFFLIPFVCVLLVFIVLIFSVGISFNATLFYEEMNPVHLEKLPDVGGELPGDIWFIRSDLPLEVLSQFLPVRRFEFEGVHYDFFIRFEGKRKNDKGNWIVYAIKTCDPDFKKTPNTFHLEPTQLTDPWSDNEKECWVKL